MIKFMLFIILLIFISLFTFSEQEYIALEHEMNEKALIYRKLSKLVDSKSSISIAFESWKEIEALWKKLELQVRV